MSFQNLVTFQLSGGKSNTVLANSRGGDISESATVQSNILHNLFQHVAKPQADSGEYRYYCIYMKVSDTLNETAFAPVFWLDRDTLSDENAFKWGFEDPSHSVFGEFYKEGYRQWRDFDGIDDFVSVASSASLQLTQFSIACWFCCNLHSGTRGYLVNKGGTGSDSAGQNDNYSLYVDSGDGKVKGGFEEASGADHYIVSDNNMSDGKWHFAVLTYDQVTLKMYIDGVLQANTETTSVSPETTGTNPLVLGRNSRASDRFYNGAMDEVRVWNNDLLASEVTDLYEQGILPQISAMVYVNKFDAYYRYSPFKRYNGTSDFDSIADTAILDLLQFSISAWIRTTSSGVEMMIANKGGTGSDTAGENMNYGILVTTANVPRVEFETSAGVDSTAQGTTLVNDGKWHHILATYDQVNLRLFVDGVQEAVTATTAVPETNAKPFVIGRNSRDSSRFFNGDIDEVAVWNNDLTRQEIEDYLVFGTIPQEGNCVIHPAVTNTNWGDDDGSRIAQTIADDVHKPLGVTFQSASSMPLTPNIGRDMKKGSYQHIWIERQIVANSKDSMDNDGLFKGSCLLTRDNSEQGEGGGGSVPPPTTSNTTLSHTGDFDCTSTSTNVANFVKTIPNLGLFLIAGDVYYGSGSPDCVYSRLGSTLKAKTKVAIGNHDDTSTKINSYKSNFSMPDTFYAVTIQNIRIIVMNSETDFDEGSDQHDFVSQELTLAKNDNNIDWIIVMIHRPFYTAQSNHDGNEGNITNIYFPLFDTAGVDLVLQAHNHNYQRSKQVKYGSGSSPTVVDGNLTTYVRKKGRVVVTNGTGGHDDENNLYSLDSNPSWQAFQSDEITGLFNMVFTGSNNEVLTCSFVDLSNDVVDTFTIQ